MFVRKPSLTLIFVDHRPNFQWRQLCQTAVTCLLGTWTNIPCSPGLVACVPRQAKSLQTLEKYFQFIIYFRRGSTKVSLFAGVRAAARPPPGLLPPAQLYIRLIRHLHQCEKKMFPTWPISWSTVPRLFNVLLTKQEISICLWKSSECT